MFEEWLEEVENTVYAYFHDDLDFFVETYGMNLETLFEDDFTPIMVVQEIQALFEEYDEGL